MRSCQQRNHYSCSSSSSSSPGDSPAYETAGNGRRKALNGRTKSLTERRKLTRQRKLRYVNDDELGTDQPKSHSQSTPVSPESTPELLSPLRYSSVPLPRPMPLPLPELAALRLSGFYSMIGGNQGSPCSSVGRTFPFNCNNTNPTDQPLPQCNTHCTKRDEKLSTLWKRDFSKDLNLDCHKLRPNASPDNSPTKSGHPFRMGWPAGRDRTNFVYPRTPQSVSFPLGPKLYLFDPPTTRYENSVAHPLPVPPFPQVISCQGCSFMQNSSSRDQWHKGKLLGRGSFGSVYAAVNRETGALCAMKEVDLIPDDPKSIESVQQLQQEIRLLRQLKHPNIVQYYGSEINKDQFYIFLEYVHPGSINKYLQDHCGAAMKESVVRSFTRHILSGLAYLHSKNTIHRDIKGANLLVDAMGVVKLADFGLAKHMTGEVSVLSLKGSPFWIAPEVLQGGLTSDTNPDIAFAVDIWSVGCTIIEMLSGKSPWGDLDGHQAMFRVLSSSPPIPATLSTVGKDFLQLCFRRNPAERPSAAKLLQHPFLHNSHDQQQHNTYHFQVSN